MKQMVFQKKIILEEVEEDLEGVERELHLDDFYLRQSHYLVVEMVVDHKLV